MQHKQFKKRQGVSLKKVQAFHLTQSIQIIKQNDQGKKSRAPASRFASIKNLRMKTQIPRSKTTRNTQYDPNTMNQNFEQKNTPKEKHPSKFVKLNLNSPITQCDQNIHHLVDQITPKAKCFYRFGIKSYQKPSHKRIYSDMMNIPSENIKGVMHIGQLWTNDMSNKFLKLNHISMNKLKFFEKLRDLKWDGIRKQKQKELDSSNLISSVKDFNQKSLKSFPTISHFDSLLSLKHFKSQDEMEVNYFPDQKQTQKMIRLQKYQNNSKEYKQIINVIRNTIDEEQTRCRTQNYWKDMKDLENESYKMHKIWDKYFGKMLQIS